MQIDTAKAAGAIAAKLDLVQAMLAQLDLVIAENWPITIVQAIAPEGSSVPVGTNVNLLTNGATPEMWKTAVSAARAAYQTELASLTAQLTALK